MEMECGWQNNGPCKDVHVLYLQMCDYVTLYDTRDFENMMWLDLEMGRLFWIIWVGPR